MTETPKAIAALLAYQQADEDGVMVLVSRQAIHEVTAEYLRLHGDKATLLSSMSDCSGPCGNDPAAGALLEAYLDGIGVAEPECGACKGTGKIPAPITSETHGPEIDAERLAWAQAKANNWTHEEVAEHARLFAAAPDLLEALISLVSMAAPHFSDEAQMLTLEEARAAIIKAEG